VLRLFFDELGRKALAATGTATGDDVATAYSCHTGAKAMAALADKLGRLVGAFHDQNSVEYVSVKSLETFGLNNQIAAKRLPPQTCPEMAKNWNWAAYGR
jgi:hypothetical protein